MQKDIRILVCGCQKIAVDIIKYIVSMESIFNKVNIKLVGVLTYDKEHDNLFCEKSVEDICNDLNICNERVEKITAEKIQSYNPDIIFSIYYRKLFPKEVIKIPKMGIVNIHPGPLPRFRGPNPTLWMVLMGETIATSTIHYIDEGMDTGDIIASTDVNINDQTGFELNLVMMTVGFELFKNNFVNILMQKNTRTKQNNDDATCCIKFRDNFRYINWMMPSKQIINQIRAYSYPYAGSIACYKNLKLVINHASLLQSPRNSQGPGYFERSGNDLIVQTFDKPIRLDDYSTNEPIPTCGRFICGEP